MSRRRIHVSLATLCVLATTHLGWATANEHHDGLRATPATTSHTASEAAALNERVAQGQKSLGKFVGEIVDLKRNAELRVGPDARATPTHTSNLPVGVRGRAVPVEAIRLEEGRADAVLKQGGARGVLLQTPDEVQAISTQGRIAMVARPDRVAVAALEGPALVGQRSVFKPLLEGQVRVFSRTTGGVTDRPLLPAPRVSSDGLSVALSGPTDVNLRASAVRLAHSYRLTLLDESGAPLGLSSEAEDPSQLVAHVPRAGSFWAIVRAIDEDGFAGEASAPLKLQVLGIRNNEEVVRHGLIFLAPGQHAQVVGQEGLVMRFGTSPEFIPAPNSIGLPGKRATTVEFRDPEHPDRYAIFRLAPRLLKTRILIGSGMSTWPEDTLDLSVRMWDGNGGSLSWMDEYQVVVKVGLDEIPIVWERVDGALKARLSPRNGSGPWVVRVSVHGPTGKELARNFLEVVKTPPAPLTLESTLTADAR